MNTQAHILEVSQVYAAFPNGNGGLQVLEDVSFGVRSAEFVSLVGPSGSGKSTLLRILAGLLQPVEGEVRLEGKPMSRPRRGVGVVFQNANLMPWRTVRENISLPLELQNIPQEAARAQAEEMVDLVGLAGFADSLPRDLSGGMAQRVAIARALAQDPEVLLLDEPFGALDALTRERMGEELLRIWHKHKKTIVMVTHDISEAVYLSDRVLVLSDRPGHIKLDLPIPLPRPRQEEMRYTPEFGSLAQQVRQAIG